MSTIFFPCSRGSSSKVAPCNMKVFLLSALIGILARFCCVHAEEEPIIDHAKNQIDWIVSNGGFFSDKLEFRRMFPDDPNSPSGLFTSEDIAKDEVVMTIPHKCLLTSGVEGSRDTCDTVRNLVNQYKLGEESEYWPYVNYAMDVRHKGDLPSEWSDEGKELLESILPEELFPGLHATTVSYEEDCDVDEATDLEQFAHLSVLRRSWDDVMIPVFDMVKHRNGRWTNVDRNSSQEGEDIRVYALRDIAANEQLYLSYNECEDCYGFANTYVLQDMLRDYGMVEQFPQRWNFERSWMIFELDEVYNNDDDMTPAGAAGAGGADGTKELKVTWISDEHDFEDKHVLHGHFARLNKMRTDVNAKAGGLASEHERSVIRSFFNALSTALDYAIMSLSDDSGDGDEEEEVCTANEEEGDSNTCSISSRSYDDLEEAPYEMVYMDRMCDFDRANRAMSSDHYRVTQVLKSHYQELKYQHSDVDDDTCLSLNGHQEVCTSVRPHYHEVLVHYPAGYLDNMERVLILGGGDNMVLHEVLKYESLKLAIVLELDQTVVRGAAENFGAHPRWNDERVEWYFGDCAKSLPMLPRDYYGTFDLVVVDLQTSIVQMLGIMDIASNLVKAEGIIIRNEDDGFGTNEAFAKHNVDLYNTGVPMWCVQGITMGSNNVDVLTRPWKPHKNISTLYFQPTDIVTNQFKYWYNYRKNDEICNETTAATNDNEPSLEQESSSGMLMILEAEDIVVPLHTPTTIEATISKALKEAGLSELFTKVASRNIQGGRTEAPYVLVFILQEGYVTARIWPKNKYCALDFLLWSRFEKQDAAKDQLIEALGSKDGKFVSSFRIVCGGMFGVSTWKEDKEKIGPPPQRAELCSSSQETEPRDNPLTQDDSNIALGESTSLVRAKDAAIAVICGDKTKPCSALDTISKDYANAMPVWTCPTTFEVEGIDDTSQRIMQMYACERESVQRMREIVAANGKLGGLVLDTGIPLAMGQILHKVFSSPRVRRELMGEKFVVIETSLSPTSSSWRRALLDRFRTDFIEFNPAFVAEILFNGGGAADDSGSLELGVFASGDDAFYSRLVSVVESIEARTRLSPDIRYVKNGINDYLAEFEPGQIFTDSNYEGKVDDADKSKTNLLMGGQSVMQFQIGDKKQDMSSTRITDALKRTLRLIGGDGMDDADVQIYDGNFGDGCVVVALWSKGNAILLWDGRSGVDLNLFTEKEPIETHDEFKDYLIDYIPSLDIVLRDDHPRGIGAS